MECVSHLTIEKDKRLEVVQALCGDLTRTGQFVDVTEAVRFVSWFDFVDRQPDIDLIVVNQGDCCEGVWRKLFEDLNFFLCKAVWTRYTWRAMEATAEAHLHPRWSSFRSKLTFVLRRPLDNVVYLLISSHPHLTSHRLHPSLEQE